MDVSRRPVCGIFGFSQIAGSGTGLVIQGPCYNRKTRWKRQKSGYMYL